MPVIKSAIKKAKQDIRNRKQNLVVRDAYKLAVKKVRKLVADGKAKEAEKALVEAYSRIDKAAKNNVIDKNAAARRKSRLSAAVKGIKASSKKTAVKKEK